MRGVRLLHPENLSGRRPLVVYLHRYPPEDERLQFSGMPLLLRRMLEHYDVLYVGMQGVLPVDPELRKGLAILELPGRVDRRSGFDKLAKLGWYYLQMPWIRRRITALKPSVIMCREPLPLIPAWMCGTGVPAMIASVSDHWWAILLGWNSPGRWLARRLEQREIARWNRWNALVVPNTEAERQVMERHGVRPENLRLINTTSPEGMFFPCEASEIRRELGFGPERIVVATHGTIRPGKGYDQLLDWWKALSSEHPDWRLLVIGGAGGEAWMRRKIRRLDLKESVRMTGWLPTQEAVNLHLNAADILLAIRRKSDDNEGIVPSVLYHNLAVGKPTVATGLPGMAEIVRDRVDGFLFEPDSYASFKNTLEYVAGHPAEAAQASESGKRRVAECFDPEACARAHLAVLGELCARGSGPQGRSATGEGS